MPKIKHRSEIEKYLTDIICSDADDMINFLQVGDDLESKIAKKLSHLSDDGLWGVQLKYLGYDSEEDVMIEIEQE